MSGALVDLVAKGVQDAYLTGNPEVSFFRQKYSRHTNFASKPVRLNYIGVPASGADLTLKIPNKGDLLSYIWIDLGSTSVSTAFGSETATPAEFELYIGGQLIDRQDATFVSQVWHKCLADSQAKVNSATRLTGLVSSYGTSNWLPLHFFFCDKLYLPLVALAYHEVELRIKFTSTCSPPSDLKVYANYILMDTNERQSIVDTDHNLLIEQVQKIYSEQSGTASNKFDLSLLNHPVKALVWSNAYPSNNFFTDEVQLYLNGTEVFDDRMPDIFFRQVTSYYNTDHNATNGVDGIGSVGSGNNIKMYPFALKVNKLQPTGTCNFSRLDTAELALGTITDPPSTSIPLYAVNYNVLRIKKGMAGLAFSN
jgi:hypothetical protein